MVGCFILKISVCVCENPLKHLSIFTGNGIIENMHYPELETVHSQLSDILQAIFTDLFNNDFLLVRKLHMFVAMGYIKVMKSATISLLNNNYTICHKQYDCGFSLYCLLIV